MGFTVNPEDLRSTTSTNLEEWMHYGYFPSGLPPSFTPAFLAQNLSNIIEAWEINCGGIPIKSRGGSLSKRARERRMNSAPVNHSIPKRIHNNSRRNCSIVHPVHQTYFVKYVCEEWTHIVQHIDSSALSLSKPVLDIKPHSPNYKRKRCLEKVKTHSELSEYRVEYSACSRYVLHVDLQGFYASIYTHAFEWALLGKETVKSKRVFGGTSPNPNLEVLGKQLDKLLCCTKEAETKGIPIGPDTSFLVAELLAVRIDNELNQRLSNLNIKYQGFRHVDDMSFYTTTRKDAEDLLEILKTVLNDYHLSLNDTKTFILRLPEDYSPSWTSQLSTFPISTNLYQLKEFFTKAFLLQKNEPSSSVLRYAIQIIRPYKKRKNLSEIELTPGVNNKQWHFLESVLAQILMVRPDNIVHIHDVLVWYKRAGFDLYNFESALVNFLIFTPKQHDHELAWGLWLAKALEISLPDEVGKKITLTESPVVKLVALDLNENNLIKGLNLSKWENELAKRSEEAEDHWLIRLFYHSNWILSYEACMHGWLGLDISVVEKDGYMSELAKRDIHFFIQDRQLSDTEIDFGLNYLGIGGLAGQPPYQ